MILFDCNNNNLAFIFRILGYLFNVIRYVIPIVLIVLATIDVVKVVLNPDDKTKKDAGSKIAKRFIYAILIFLVPTLISLIFDAVEGNNPDDYGQNGKGTYDSGWKDCIREIFK